MGLLAYVQRLKRAKAQQRLAEKLGLVEAWAKLNADLLDAEEFPGGTGDLGLSPDNPIPCPDPDAYFARLRTLTGHRVQLRGGRFSTRSSVTPKPVDAYAVVAEGRNVLVYLCIYCRRNSSRAPAGFKLS